MNRVYSGFGASQICHLPVLSYFDIYPLTYSTRTHTRPTIITQANLCQLAPLVKNWSIFLEQRFTAHVSLLMTTSKVYVDLYSTLSWLISKALRYGTC